MLTQCFWSPLVQLSFSLLSLSLRITLCLSLSPGPSPHLEGWQTTAGPPPPICPSGQSLFGKLSTDHVNRGQHVRWWTSVQMSPVETAVVCLLLRVFPALQGLLFPSTDPTYKERAAHPYWPWCTQRAFFGLFKDCIFVSVMPTVAVLCGIQGQKLYRWIDGLHCDWTVQKKGLKV